MRHRPLPWSTAGRKRRTVRIRAYLVRWCFFFQVQYIMHMHYSRLKPGGFWRSWERLKLRNSNWTDKHAESECFRYTRDAALAISAVWPVIRGEPFEVSMITSKFPRCRVDQLIRCWSSGSRRWPVMLRIIYTSTVYIGMDATSFAIPSNPRFPDLLTELLGVISFILPPRWRWCARLPRWTGSSRASLIVNGERSAHFLTLWKRLRWEREKEHGRIALVLALPWN